MEEQKQKVKVLSYRCDDYSGFKVVSVYNEESFKIADDVFEKLQEFASSDRCWKLEELELI